MTSPSTGTATTHSTTAVSASICGTSKDALRQSRDRNVQHADRIIGRVLDIYAGDLAEDLSTEWVEVSREALRRDVLDAVSAHTRTRYDMDPGGALALLERLRRLDPYNESLYRETARLQADLGRHDAIAGTLALLTTMLADIDEEPSPEPSTLVLGSKTSTARQGTDVRARGPACPTKVTGTPSRLLPGPEVLLLTASRQSHIRTLFWSDLPMSQPPNGFGPPPEPYRTDSTSHVPLPPPPPFPPAAPAQPPHTPRRNRRRLAIVVSAAVVSLAVLAGVLVFTKHDSTSAHPPSAASTHTAKPGRANSTSADVFYSVPGQKYDPTSDPNEGVPRTPGSWTTETSYVSAVPQGIQGYNLRTGKSRWKIQLAGNICDTSITASSNHEIAVVYTPKVRRSRCTELAVVDIAKGKVRWHKKFSEELAAYGDLLNVAINDDVAAVGWPGVAYAYRIADGQTVWDRPKNGCTGEEYHGDGHELLAIMSCGDAKKEAFKAELRDTQTGKVKWQYALPEGLLGVWAVSMHPAVFAAALVEDALSHDVDMLITVDDQGKTMSTINLKEKYRTGCMNGDGNCSSAVVTDDAIYIATIEDSDGKRENSIASFDIKSGKKRWQITDRKKQKYQLIRSDKQGLIVLLRPTVQDASLVERIDPRTGAGTVLLSFKSGMGSYDLIESIADSDGSDPALYEHGLLIMHHSYSLYPDWDKYMTVVSGPK